MPAKSAAAGQMGEAKPDSEYIDNASGQAGPAEEYAYLEDTLEERALVRKIDRRLLPMLWVMYIFNYIDRTNIGNAKTGGMQADLKLTSSDYSLVLSIFFIGCMSIGVKGVNSFGGMVGWRFCLGLVEAGFFPGVMLLMSCWYKPAELSKRVAMFYTASLVSGAFGGLLAGGIITGLEGVGGTRGWKWLFIIEGLITVVLAVIAFFVLPGMFSFGGEERSLLMAPFIDYPSTTKWLSEKEKKLALIRIAAGNISAEEEIILSHKEAFLASVKDLRTWGFLLLYNLITCAGTISYFFPTLMTSLGYTGNKAQFAFVISVITGVSADRTRMKAVHTFGACVLGVISFVICVTVSNNTVRYVFICFGGAGIWTATPIFLSWMITMFDGREKRAVSIALVNGFGNLASVYGSFLWPSTDAPMYHIGFGVTTALLGTAAGVTALLKWAYGDKGVMRS
ncbi:hypothetical protein JCM24511_05328 [Saitozyma sp. JCM 24511]|nr:hypothetical protein JCM24511_05328 [Saitozyma sp. JCM 24511]